MSRGDGLPVPEPPDIFAMHSDVVDSVSSNGEEMQASASRDADILPSRGSSKHKITEGVLIDLNSGFEFSKYKAEVLASRLKEWNLLQYSVK